VGGQLNDAPATWRSSPVARVLASWLPIAVVATVLCALVAGAVQQDLRQTADDPQIQLAEDAATALAGGREPGAVVPAGEVDLAASLAPFVIVFDDAGKPLASSARLDGEVPIPPPGVFDFTREHGADRFTWQPRSGVRLATVVVRSGGGSPGFVLAGRSLREVERRVDQIQLMVVFGWVVALGASLVAVVGQSLLTRVRPRSES
jgi:hypothetical protein